MKARMIALALVLTVFISLTNVGFGQEDEYLPHASVSREPISMVDMAAADSELLQMSFGELTIIARCRYAGDGEEALVSCFDKDSKPIWSYSTSVSDVSELAMTDVWIAGTEASPLVAVYNAMLGLTMLTPSTGKEVWTLPVETVSLGGSVCYTQQSNGVLYVAGYYGPDPVAIACDGTVMWQSTVDNDDVYWPYRMDISDGCLQVYYGSYENVAEDGAYLVCFDLNSGAVLSIEPISIQRELNAPE